MNFKQRILVALGAFATLSFSNFAGSIARLTYDGIAGSAVSALTNAAIFPNSPTFREQLDDFLPSVGGQPIFGFQSKENNGNNFGSFTRGYLAAPATGDYNFFIASDDSSELRLSTDHTEGNRRKITFESGSGAELFSTNRLSERRSAAIPLVKGQKYYLEVLHKQAAGSSYLRMGWQRPDGTVEVIPARHLFQHPLDPFIGRVDADLAPTFNVAGLNGGDLPGTVAAVEGESVVLELDVIAAQPVTIEWKRNGATIEGENLSFLKFDRIPFSANGDEIEAIVANNFGTLTSAKVQLNVSRDTTPPTVASVEHRGNPNALRVEFSEPIADVSANLANYSLAVAGGAAIPISSAVLQVDLKTVVLSGSFGFAVNGNYELTASNIDDRAEIPNRLAPNPTVKAFTFAGEFLGLIGFDPAQPLQNLSVLENRVARFEAALVGAKPWFYQWSSNGVAIDGATNRFLDVIAAAGAGGSFQVSVSNEFSSATSPQAQLTVSPDNAPARIESVRGFAGLNTVKLKFDEVIAVSSATNINNYSIPGVAVTGASLSGDGRLVTLATASLQKGETYLISVIGIKDIASQPNSTTATASFRAEVDFGGEALADGPVRYWRLNELSGSSVASVATGVDALSVGVSTLVNEPTVGAPSLLRGNPDDTAISFSAASSERITVPNGSDLNATAGPWAKKTIEFWFRASSVPGPDTTGLAATAGIWEQGAATRSIAAYLWRDPANSNPNEAALVFHAFNAASDGPGAPFGLTSLPAVFVQHTVSVGQTYHVVAVFDGDNAGVNGNLILYVNGEEVGRAAGVGQIYNHTGDVQIGRGNGVIHTGENGDFGFFDGVLDEVLAYNKALSASRAAAHYQAGLGSSSSDSAAPSITNIETRGDPNSILVTFSKPLSSAATNAANFSLKTSADIELPIANRTLLPGGLTIRLDGLFNLQGGSTYTLVSRDVVDQSVPGNVLNPNPTTNVFTFSAGVVGAGPGSELGSRSAFENQVVRFAIVPSGAGPFSYQWFRNGVALAGENHSELFVIASDETSGNYTVRVENDFSSFLSNPAALSLETDFTAPRIVSVKALAGSINEVRFTLDEPVDLATGTAPLTYSLGTVPVLAASVATNGVDVTVKTGPLQNGQTYTLAITGLKDRAAAGNILITNVTFSATSSYVDELLKDNPVRYWRFEETNGTTAKSLANQLDTIASSSATYVNAPKLGVTGLVPNLLGGLAVQLTATNNQRLTVPNGSDINATAGPWAKKSLSLWFKATSLPAGGATPQAPVLWEQGADSRGLGLYLYGIQDVAAPTEALLVWHVYNNVVADGVTGGWGAALGNTNKAVYIATPVQANVAYNVVAVYDGDTTGTNGSIRLYVNGEVVGSALGAGQLFNHTGDVQIGRGAFLRHDGITAGNLHFFDGIIDELAVYNKALTTERIAQLYDFAWTDPVSEEEPRITDVKIQNGNLVITWEGEGLLGVANSIEGPYTPIQGASSPYSEQVNGVGQRYFQVIP